MQVTFLCHDQNLRIASAVLNAKKYAEKVLVIDQRSTDGTDVLARSAGAEVMRASRQMSMAELLNAMNGSLSQDAVLMINLDDSWEFDTLVPSIAAYRNNRQDVSVVLQEEKLGQILSNGMLLEDITLGDIGIFRSLFFTQTGLDALIEIGDNTLGKLPESMNVNITRTRRKNGRTPSSSRKQGGIFQLIKWMFKSGHPLVLFGLPGLLLTVISFYLLSDVVSGYESIASVHIGVTIATVSSTVIGLFSLMAALTFYILGKQMEFLKTNTRR